MCPGIITKLENKSFCECLSLSIVGTQIPDTYSIKQENLCMRSVFPLVGSLLQEEIAQKSPGGEKLLVSWQWERRVEPGPDTLSR